MAAEVKPIPDGYVGAIPYLCCKDASAEIDFCRAAFGAVESMRMDHDGRVGHAELKIGDATIMLSDEYPEMGVVSPETLGGTPCAIHLYVQDVDTVYAKAVAAGAEVLRPLENQFYGDRGAKLRDPAGHFWLIATHIEDVAPDEMKRRAAALFGG